MAAFLAYGLRVWSGVFVGSFVSIVYYFIVLEHDSPLQWQNLIVNLVTSAGNTGAAALCWFWLARERGPGKLFFGSRQLFFAFFPATALYGTLTAILGVGIYKVIDKPMLWGGAIFTDAVLRWSISDMVAILVFTPPLVLWLRGGPVRVQSHESWQLWAVTLTSLILGMGLFSPLSRLLEYPLLQPVALLLPLLWGTVRFPRLGSVVWNLLAFLALWWGTDAGYGAFVMETRERSLDAMQVFAGLTSMAILLLRAAVMAERRVGRRLAFLAKTLEERVKQRTGHLRNEITERQRMEEALRVAKEKAEEANRAKSLFLATMSHEIRTPLSGMIVQTQLLLSGVLAASQRERAETIRDLGRILVSLLGDILDISRIEAGGVVLEERDFRIATLFREIRTLMIGQVEAKGLTLRWELPEEMSRPVRGDPARLRQILFNLVGNAVKFTREGSIVVAVERLREEGERNWFRFEVRDTGVGVPAEAGGRIFSLFTQADGSISKRYGGVGLGLALCRRLVEAMGGEIGFSSRVGEGSTFWFTVALSPGQEADESRSPVVTPPPATLLLVDDDEFSRNVNAELLASHGHRVVTAANGAEALGRMRQERFDAVLMDLCMAGMDGAFTVARIRALEEPEAARVPVIALTADVTLEGREMCRMAGMQGFLAKPLEISSFNEALHDLTSRSGMAADAMAPRLLDVALLDRRFDELGEERMREHASRYPERLRERIGAVEACWEKRDLSRCRDEAHALKGLALTMGLAELGQVCRVLQDACDSGAMEVGAELLPGLRELGEQSLIGLRRFMEERGSP
ncbi:MAG: response regulator [Magnetococcales bacterium]|nr:response regulator [Magnetococcales bacterium]